MSFIYGLRLDISTAGYLMVLPTLLWITYIFIQKKIILQSILFLQGLFLFLIVGILIGNIGIYAAWGTLINARALAFLQDPEGIIASQTTFELISRLAIWLLITLALLSFFKKKILFVEADHEKKRALVSSFFFLLFLPLGIRGGWQEIPINESAASYSEVIPLNHAATNPVWYLLNNINKSGLNKKNPYVFFDDATATNHFNQQIDRTTEFTQVLDSTTPNIILIVLESWTADIIAPLNNSTAENITPFFSTLCDSGLLFTNIYSSGRRTDQMFPSLLCGFPAPPNHSVSRFSDKLQHLPFLSKDLSKAGYQNSFYYGGELGFANMNTFLHQAEFSSISGKDNYLPEQIFSKWGAHDEHLFNKLLNEADHKKNPFFTMMLTLSTHEPFDVPREKKFGTSTESDKFKSAAYYTDQCLKKFFESARKTKWYSNTLFILVADHGHMLPLKRDYYDPATYRIPLLWVGDPLKKEFRGKQDDQLGGQHEIAYTLLQQLHFDASEYKYSNNLLSQGSSKGVYLNYDSGFGWKEGGDQLVYLFTEKKYLPYTYLSSDSSAIKNGKSFLQKTLSRISRSIKPKFIHPHYLCPA
ncbi:MAG: LTA synthase family protein [Bacteroidetes bacterium]|nr:LTA synthase family protein [Bacteroidota bacterium]